MTTKILGCLSERYESNGKPETISHYQGDYGNRNGGGSYGCYQMTSTTVKNYLAFIKPKYPEIYNVLIKYAIASKDFDNAWLYVAKTYPKFKESQWYFIKKSFYDPTVNRLHIKLGININSRSFALMNAIWSTSVQFGISGCERVFANAIKGKKLSTISDKDLISAIYAERGRDGGKAWFSKSSEQVRKGVLNRFKNELEDALKLLAEEVSKEAMTLEQTKEELIRSFIVTTARIKKNQEINLQIKYIEELFVNYKKLGGR